MALLDFTSVAGACASSTDLTLVAFARSLGTAITKLQSSFNASLVGRVRSPGDIISAVGQFQWVADLKRSLRLATAVGNCLSSTSAQYFLNAVITPPPRGGLSLPSVNSVLNPRFVAAGFSGNRFVRGDLIPIQFRVQGQQLLGLNATFYACRTDLTPETHTISKVAPGSISQTDPVLDTNTQVETVTGTFTLDPGDTSGFPDGEIQLDYTFLLSDGLGRVYTLEVGKFTIYSVC